VRFHEGLLLRDVPSRFGTAAGVRFARRVLPPAAAAPQALAVRNPAHTRVRGYSVLARAFVPGYVRTVRDRNQFVTLNKGACRFYNGPITARSRNGHRRSTVHSRGGVMPRLYGIIVTRITAIL
jgi:hypothetical protein